MFLTGFNPLKTIRIEVVCLCFFLLRPPTKPCYRGVTMHALFFFCRGGKVKHSDESVLPVLTKEGKGKDKWTIAPKMNKTGLQYKSCVPQVKMDVYYYLK